ncbi:MAG: SusE domain-containing protein [Prevotellaceae bacterium]|jgi:hypothetical protein|nr:SusE domain-containing protein [Prevotellaceae bacterium]
MKKFIILFASTVFAFFSACENEIEKIKLTPEKAPGNLAVTPNDFVCTQNNANDTAFTFSWTEANFGDYIATTYYLEFDVAGNNFSSPCEISAGNKTNAKTVTSEQMNLVMHTLGQAIETPTNIEVRIKALPFVSGAAQPELTPLISESTTSITLTSYAMPPLHMLGSMFDNYADCWCLDWFWNFSNYKYVMFRDNPLAQDVCVALMKNADGSGLQGEMAFIEDGRLGTYTSLNKDTDGKLKYGGSNILIPSAGYFEVKVDLSKMTYSINPYDTSESVDYANVELTGLGAAIPLSQEHNNPHIWFADDVALTAGQTVEFHANSPSVTWGGESFPWGKGHANGENINILKSGNYFIKFNDLTGHYIFYKKS